MGQPFLLNTDHAPLQWLSAQKVESMLCRWALVMQEYDFKIVYRKGSLNTNADALSFIQQHELHVLSLWLYLTIPCQTSGLLNLRMIRYLLFFNLVNTLMKTDFKVDMLLYKLLKRIT